MGLTCVEGKCTLSKSLRRILLSRARHIGTVCQFDWLNVFRSGRLLKWYCVQGLAPTGANTGAETPTPSPRSHQGVCLPSAPFYTSQSKDRIWSQKVFFFFLFCDYHKPSKEHAQNWQEQITAWIMPWIFGGKVPSGYVSGTMRSMLPQPIKEGREWVCPWDNYLPGVKDWKVEKAHKDLTIWEKPKHSLKPPVSWQIDIGRNMPKQQEFYQCWHTWAPSYVYVTRYKVLALFSLKWIGLGIWTWWNTVISEILISNKKTFIQPAAR